MLHGQPRGRAGLGLAAERNPGSVSAKHPHTQLHAHHGAVATPLVSGGDVLVSLLSLLLSAGVVSGDSHGPQFPHLQTEGSHGTDLTGPWRGLNEVL